jgi:hypothetical protein
MRAPILDQPFIAVAGGHEEKVNRDHGDELPIRTGDIAHGQERVGDRDIGFDEADPVVGKRRLRGGGASSVTNNPIASIELLSCVELVPND